MAILSVESKKLLNRVVGYYRHSLSADSEGLIYLRDQLKVHHNLVIEDCKIGYIHINGKGNKQRMVPVCSRVCRMVTTFIERVRPRLVKGTDHGYLVVNRFGNRINPNGIWAVVKRHSCRAGIKKNVSTHTFRHTCATHMMKNGAPIRHIQELLGHESLESTQIYTRVTINDLKAAHEKYHPGNPLD